MSNSQLSSLFQQIGHLYDKSGQVYKKKTYTNASVSIKNFPEAITSGDQVRKAVRGVGASVAKDIDEFLATGQINRLKLLEQEVNSPRGENEKTDGDKDKVKVLELFEGVYGVGPKTSENWYSMGHRTLGDLKAVHMTPSQKLGYKHYHHLQERIPRAEMDLYAQHIQKVFSQHGIDGVIAGSYRRGLESSGDIDVLVRKSDKTSLDTLIEALNSILIGTLAHGKSKFMGISRISPKAIARRIDLLVVAPDVWSYAILYFTGSAGLNVRMREKAISMGLTLNEYGLIGKDGYSYPAKTEQDIFKHLNIPYLKPTERNE